MAVLIMPKQTSINDKMGRIRMEHECFRLCLKSGTGFMGGKERVKKFFNTNDSVKDRVNMLKDEFGVGGYSSTMWDGPYDKETKEFTRTIEYYGYHGNNHDAEGLEVHWRDAKLNEYKTLYPWTAVAGEIDRLIAKGEY